MDVCPPFDQKLRLFSHQHLWFSPLTADWLVFGLSEFYQNQLSDVLFVDFVVSNGQFLTANSIFCVLESSKALTEISLPFPATVGEFNALLGSAPALINQQPEASGWIGVIRPLDDCWQKNLLSEAQYQRYLDQ